MKNIAKILLIGTTALTLGSCAQSGKVDRHGIYRVSTICGERHVVKNSQHARYHPGCGVKQYGKKPRWTPKRGSKGNKLNRNKGLYKTK